MISAIFSKGRNATADVAVNFGHMAGCVLKTWRHRSIKKSNDLHCWHSYLRKVSDDTPLAKVKEEWWSPACRVQGFALGVLGCRVQGLGFKVQGLGSRV